MMAHYKRKEIIGNSTLYLADCNELLPELGNFDAIVTDPPYEFNADGAGFFRKKRKNMDEIKYLNLNKGFNHEIIKANQFDSIIIFIHNDQLVEILQHLTNEYDRFAVCSWIKTNPMPVANNHYQPDTEIYVHAWKKGHHPVGSLQTKKRYIIAKNGKDSKINHPTVKPINVMMKIINNINGENVIDPFMGSGSTGVACIKQGKKFTGIEYNEKFFEIACNRINETYSQPDMLLSEEENHEKNIALF